MKLDNIFNITLLLKGFNAILEIISGILLSIIKPEQISNIVSIITTQEIVEDPKDIIANFLVNLSHNYSINTNTFWVLYLMSHGLIKIILVSFLIRRNYKVYPFAIFVFVLFLLYEVYKLFIDHSFSIIILILVDILMLCMTILEYKRHNKS